MATGSEVHGHHNGSVGFEKLPTLKCQPCLEDGDLQEAVGMCVDCQDYLCLKCYQCHKLPKPMRRHQLMDREQMVRSEIRVSPKDACTEKCSIHHDEVITYYCTTHSQLGCSKCITLNHTTCKDVQHIPTVAQELASSKEYKQVEKRLSTALKTLNTVSENTKRNSEVFTVNCNETFKKIKDHRRKVEEAIAYNETKLVEKLQAIKIAQIKEFGEINNKYKIAQEELQTSLTKIETLENSRHHCGSYIEMMRTKEKLKNLDAKIKEAKLQKPCTQRQVIFTPTLATIDTLKSIESFGTVALSSTETVTSVKHAKDINVKTSTDTKPCMITGAVILTNGKLVLADHKNINMKTFNADHDQILSQLKLSTAPWDITAISQNKVAVTLPGEKKIDIVTVGDNNLSIDKTLTVNGACYGVDYRNDKLAVSFNRPHKIQVVNMQGSVLYDISSDRQGHPLFNGPYYLTYGLNDTTLYVSNHWGHNVVCVNLDGTVVATYKDNDLQYPRTPVLDSSGNVYVCAAGSNTVHQISKDCKKLRVKLNKVDGCVEPCSICLNKEEDILYMTSFNKDCVQVYEREKKPTNYI